MNGKMNNAKGDAIDKPAASVLLKRWGPVALLVIAGAIVLLNGWHKYLSLEQLALHRESLSAFIAGNLILALLIYMALYTVSVALSLPGGAILTLAGGFLFGWFLGGVSTVIAATFGATLVFLIAKSSFGEHLAARAGPWLEKLRNGFQDNALNYLLFLRLVPIFPFWLINLAPALLGVKLQTYIWGTFIGIIPGTFAFTFLGAGLGSVIDAQQKAYETCLAQKGDTECTFSIDPSALITKEILFAFAALGVVALIPVFMKKFKKSSDL